MVECYREKHLTKKKKRKKNQIMKQLKLAIDRMP